MLKDKVDTIKPPTTCRKKRNVSALFQAGRYRKGSIRDVFCTNSLHNNSLLTHIAVNNIQILPQI